MSVAELSQAQLSLFFLLLVMIFNLNSNCSDPIIIVNPLIIFKVMPIFCFMICTNISICLTVLEEGLINRNIAREVFKLLEEEIPVVIFSYPKNLLYVDD
jgi:hypothetical protein